LIGKVVSAHKVEISAIGAIDHARYGLQIPLIRPWNGVATVNRELAKSRCL
jgi:hypothetical protein